MAHDVWTKYIVCKRFCVAEVAATLCTNVPAGSLFIQNQPLLTGTGRACRSRNISIHFGRFSRIQDVQLIGWPKANQVTRMTWASACILKGVISTKDALRIPMTYDNHPIPSHPSTYSIDDDLSNEDIINLMNLQRQFLWGSLKDSNT